MKRRKAGGAGPTFGRAPRARRNKRAAGTQAAPSIPAQTSRVGATASVSNCSLISAGEGLRLPAPAPTSPPAAAPATLVAHELDDHQEQQRANRGVDDHRDKARAKVDAEPRQQPGADERSDDSDDEVAGNSEPGAAHDLSSQPSGDEADQEDDDKTLARHENHPSLL